MADDCPFALSNADRIEQVLVILLDNALKFTPEGGSITLSADWDEQVITLTVADTGSGINPDDLPHVFDRFYKADKAHTGSGTGLRSLHRPGDHHPHGWPHLGQQHPGRGYTVPLHRGACAAGSINTR